MRSPTCSSAEENDPLLCPLPPGDAAAHTPGPARRARITIFSAFLTLPVLPMSSNRTQEEMSGLVDNPRWNGFNNRNREISNMFVDRRTMGQEEALREEKS
jgi:hypothetical protein